MNGFNTPSIKNTKVRKKKMEDEEIKRMKDIESRSQFEIVSEEDKRFFNDNYYKMLDYVEGYRNHWQYHTKKFNLPTTPQ